MENNPNASLPLKEGEKKPEEKVYGHICPYCGQVNMQINNHFAHIEFFHEEEKTGINNL